MRFELFVALRYLRGKRKNRFVNLITILSVAGVGVGVMTLIVVMSVMTGFDIALRDTIIGNRSHLTIVPRSRAPLVDYKAAIADAMAICPEIEAGAPIMQEVALFQRRDMATGGFIMGVDTDLETGVTQFKENLTQNDGRTYGAGDPPADKEIVLGYRMAMQLGARIGSDIAVLTANPTATPFGTRAGKKVYLRVSGISHAKMAEWDNYYAFVNLKTAMMLTGKEGADGVHFKLTDPEVSVEVRKRIEDNMNFDGETFYESQREYFGALEQEKFAMFVILVFIILVAAFNITSILIMIVMEKRRDIGILRTLGVGTRTILLIFILEGLMIGLSGTFAGLFLGTAIAYKINPIAIFIGKLVGIDVVTSNFYYFDRIPTAIVPSDIMWITICSVVLTFMSTLYPAWSAARINPVDALRHD
ncbi:MAG: ABC transporter permease [Candidatus Hydrogenedentes bacterium]|nr:ABC transporter permease [Candidatus Hydrogenedentota bacterium]